MNVFEFLSSISVFRFLVIVIVTGQVILFVAQIIGEIIENILRH